mgnify:CR=1 FL=1
MILRTKNNPCYRCKDRELYCHDNCYRYATYKQKMERASKAAREHKEINNYIHTVVCATRNGQRRYKRKCKYCENKEGHILEQKKNLVYVTCGVCGEVIDIVGGRMAKQLKEKLKGVV